MDENERLMARVNARKVFRHGCALGSVEPGGCIFDLVTFCSRSGTFAAYPTRRCDGLQLFYWPHRTGD